MAENLKNREVERGREHFGKCPGVPRQLAPSLGSEFTVFFRKFEKIFVDFGRISRAVQANTSQISSEAQSP